MFKQWLENRQLANNYKSILSGVPQDPHHHPEGDVLSHVRLVRKAIPRAVLELRNIQQHPEYRSILGDLNFTLTPQEEKVLIVGAWLHDVGKASATTVDPITGRVQSLGHQDAEHYGPQIAKILQFAPPETAQLYLQNKRMVDFLIDHHMDLAAGGFSKEFISKYFRDGKVLNVPEMKLLLILMWADRLGRGTSPEVQMQALMKAAGQISISAERGRRRDFNIANQSKPFTGGPEQFAQMLSSRPIAPNQKMAALKNKFPSLSDVEIADLLR